MPQSELSYRRVAELLRAPLTDARFEELLFASKAELVERDGDQLQVSVTPDRLDLLSEGGLALYLQGVTGESTGLPPIARARPTDSPAPFEIQVDPNVAQLRPQVAALRLHSPSDAGIDPGTLAEAIRFQEILHASLGRDRRSASLGLYAVARMRPPLRYALEPIRDMVFDPLDGTGPIPAARFFKEHPMAQKYGPLGSANGAGLVLRDAQGAIASLPPILNARGAGEVRPGDRELLLESTGTNARAVRESVQMLLLVFAARGYRVDPVPIVDPGGRVRSSGEGLFEARRLHLGSDELAVALGARLSEEAFVRLAQMARMSARSVSAGWEVEAPPWRPDLLGPPDVAEEILFARGLEVDAPVLLPSATLGRRSPERIFRRQFGPALLGVGYSPVYTPVLVSESAILRSGRRAEAIHVSNAPSTEFSYVRPSLGVSLLESLRRNLRSGYPQRLSEVGPVVRRSEGSETGADTRFHVGWIFAADRAGFADVASLVDYLLRTVDVTGVREPAELPATTPGRAARVRIAGELVAELGEIHPEVLEQLGVPVPAAWGEIDLSALWPLVRRSGTV
ncbi:MAG: hypothetical protein ACREBZ_05140 [Thermoplasmata archaeon]